jgi:hypothetical protein
MTDRDERIKEFKFNIERAVEELADTTSKYSSDSPEVAHAKENRALKEKALYDFLDEEN